MYRLMPAVLLSGFFFFGLKPYQFSRLLGLFSPAPEVEMYIYRSAFELGGAWGTDMSLAINTDMQIRAEDIGDISTSALPLLGYWQGWVIAAAAVFALLVLVCLLLIQIGKSRSGPMKTFGLGAVALFSVSLLISVASTIGVLPFFLFINHGVPFLGFNAVTLLGIILVGLAWYEGKSA
jgi:cell division protein FtsW (lipid II flippase)